MDSVAIKGSSSFICFWITFGYTTIPSEILSAIMTDASAARNISE
jgi:hypothetical protein